MIQTRPQPKAGGIFGEHLIDRSLDRQERWQAFGRSGALTLLVPRLECDAAVGARWINHAEIVLTEKRAGVPARQHHRLPFLLNSPHCRLDRHSGVLRVGLDQAGLPHDVQVIGLDDQSSLATGAALVALKLRHRGISKNGGLSIGNPWQPATIGLHKSSESPLRFRCAAYRAVR